jgi:hypothetical protein
METQFPSRGPERDSSAQSNVMARAHACTSVAHPHDGGPRREACAFRLFYKNDPDLPTNHVETHGTIPTVSYFVDKPSEEPVFTTATPSTPPRAHWHGSASTRRLRQPDRSLPAPKCESMLT